MITTQAVFLVMLYGLVMCGIPIVYRWGQTRQVPALPIGFFLMCGGLVYFTSNLTGELLKGCPWMILAVGFAGGLSQWGVLHLIAAALRRGPLSPLNCAIFLSFVVLIVFSYLAFGEEMSLLQLLGVVLAVACVACGAFLGDSTSGKSGEDGLFVQSAESTVALPAKPGSSWLLYGVILLAIFLINSFIFVCIKYLSMVPTPGEGSLMAKFGNAELAAVYLGGSLGIGCDMARAKLSRRELWLGLAFGAGGAVCSAGALAIMRDIAYLPSAFVFPVSAIASILVGAVLSVVFFRERMTRMWWAMMGCGLVTAALLIIDVLSK